MFVPIGAVHKSPAAQQVTLDVIVAGVVLSTCISALLSLLLISSREINFSDPSSSKIETLASGVNGLHLSSGILPLPVYAFFHSSSLSVLSNISFMYTK
jgi:hypothetical protein